MKEMVIVCRANTYCIHVIKIEIHFTSHIFGARFDFSMDTCHISPQCELGVVPLTRVVSDFVVIREKLHWMLSRGLLFALWLS